MDGTRGAVRARPGRTPTLAGLGEKTAATPPPAVYIYIYAVRWGGVACGFIPKPDSAPFPSPPRGRRTGGNS
jgi:hypothetical protein